MTQQPASFPHGGICVSIAAADTAGAVSAVLPIQQDVNVVEIRLDAMQEANIPELCRRIDRPLLFTNRPAWEGGLSTEQEEKRISLLLEAARHQAALVDLELKTAMPLRERLLDSLSTSQTRLIISHHDFDRTPDSASLSNILQQQVQSGAHIGKIVTMAHDHLDVLRVLHLQCEAQRYNFPLIAFCMGQEGKISRVITLLLGGFMTYAALNEQQATAPGQLSVAELRNSLSILPGSHLPGEVL